MEAQNGRLVGGQKLVDYCGSRFYVNRGLYEVELEGKEHNMIVSLKFSIIKCVKGRTNKGFMGQVRSLALV